MNPLDEVVGAVNGFYVKYGVRPEYVFDPLAATDQYHVQIVDERDPSHVVWTARGATIDDALAKLAEQMAAGDG